MKKVVFVLLVSFVLMGSGKNPPPLPLRGTFALATKGGEPCVMVRERTKANGDEGGAPQYEVKYVVFEGKKRVISDACSVEMKTVDEYEAWLVTKDGKRFAFEDGFHAPPSEGSATPSWFDATGGHVEIRVDDKTHRVFELGAATSQGVALSVRSTEDERRWGVRATTHYGTALCPHNGQEVLVVIDRKTQKSKIIYNGFVDHLPEAEEVPHTSLRGLTEKKP